MARTLKIKTVDLLALLDAEGYLNLIRSLGLTDEDYAYVPRAFKTSQTLESILETVRFKELLQTILGENWSDSSNGFGIDPSKFFIPKHYIEEKKCSLQNVFSDAHSHGAVDEELKSWHLILLMTIATKLFLEAKKVNANLPTQDSHLGSFSQSTPSPEMSYPTAIIDDYDKLCSSNKSDAG